MLAQLPNAITLLRILLVLPTGWLLWHGYYVEALVLMSVAGASDALDGWLARRLNVVSSFGAALDPLADKLLVATMFVIFTLQGHLPLWTAIVILGRDAIIVAGASAYRLLYGRVEFVPTPLSKANTALQIATALLLLLWLCDFAWVSGFAGTLADPYAFYLLVVLGVASGLDYVFTWGGRAWRAAGS